MDWSTKLRVVLDSNVFVSGIVWGGNPEKVLKLWREAKFRLFISPSGLLEILGVLSRFKVPVEMIDEFKFLIENHATKVIPRSRFYVCRDTKDNQYLNLSYECQADYLVTGDHDLLALKKFKKTKILKPKEFLKQIQAIDKKKISLF